MVFWRGKEIENYTKDELEQEIDFVYESAEVIKKQEIYKYVLQYKHDRSWAAFNKISATAATNIDDYIRTRKIFPELVEIIEVYKRKYFTE